jgi:HD-GYP domain-containing protein (c-di-GMP phosphodiesterase class II)
LPANLPGIELYAKRRNDDEPVESEANATGTPEFRVPTRIYQSAARSLDQLMNRVRHGESVKLDDVTALVECVVEEVTATGTRILGPIHLTPADSFTFQHSINVFLIATTLLQPFAGSRDELLAMAQAALLHDIGKSRIPAAILNKRSDLAADELAVMRQHPVLGARVLLELGGVDPLAVEVAYCHHMHDEGLGYPDSILPIKPGPVTRIVQVADMFEALTAARPYKERLSVKEATEILQHMPGMDSKRPALELLLARLTDSPPGSEVILSSGERARVVRSNEDAPDRPIVRLVTDAGGAPLETTEVLDLREEPSRSIAQVILRPTADALAGEA